jgi:hypothetical protein
MNKENRKSLLLVARIIEIASDIRLPRSLLIHTDLQIGDEGGQNLLGTVSTVGGGCREEKQFKRLPNVAELFPPS